MADMLFQNRGALARQENCNLCTFFCLRHNLTSHNGSHKIYFHAYFEEHIKIHSEGTRQLLIDIASAIRM